MSQSINVNSIPSTTTTTTTTSLNTTTLMMTTPPPPTTTTTTATTTTTPTATPTNTINNTLTTTAAAAYGAFSTNPQYYTQYLQQLYHPYYSYSSASYDPYAQYAAYAQQYHQQVQSNNYVQSPISSQTQSSLLSSQQQQQQQQQIPSQFQASTSMEPNFHDDLTTTTATTLNNMGDIYSDVRMMEGIQNISGNNDILGMTTVPITITTTEAETMSSLYLVDNSNPTTTDIITHSQYKEDKMDMDGEEDSNRIRQKNQEGEEENEEEEDDDDDDDDNDDEGAEDQISQEIQQPQSQSQSQPQLQSPIQPSQEIMAMETNEKIQDKNVTDVNTWSCEMVRDWITSVENGKYAQYASTFFRNEINGDILCSLTLKDLDQGLYINNLRQRMNLYDLICSLKESNNNKTRPSMITTSHSSHELSKPLQSHAPAPNTNTTTTNTTMTTTTTTAAATIAPTTAITTIPVTTTVTQPPPQQQKSESKDTRTNRNKRKRKTPDSNIITPVSSMPTSIPTSITNNDTVNINNHRNNDPHPQAPSTMLFSISKSSIENKTPLQLLPKTTPMTMANNSNINIHNNNSSNSNNNNINDNITNNINNMNSINNNDMKKTEEKIGETIDIEWNFRDQDIEPLHVQINDQIHFQWKFTRNVWLFKNHIAYLSNDFSQGEQLMGCDGYKYLWKAMKPGTYYFGCQIGNCAKVGHMKLIVYVHDTIPGGNILKRRKL